MTKILTLDIETSPHKSLHFGIRNVNLGINQVLEWSEPICFSAKWTDKPDVMFWSDFHHGREEMITNAFGLIEEADAVVTYNGDAFDLRKLNDQFDQFELGKPSPFVSIDLYKVAKANFGYDSKKLDNILQQLGIGEKKKTGGFDLWIGCVNGDISSWAKMRDYNKEDTVLTELLFQRWRPWITNIPNFNLMNDTEDRCYNCGSDNFQRRGYKLTNIAKYQKFWCKDCGAWNTSGKAERISTMRALK